MKPLISQFIREASYRYPNLARLGQVLRPSRKKIPLINLDEELEKIIGKDEELSFDSITALADIYLELPPKYSLLQKMDPFSADYEKLQFELYQEISGKNYRIENEATPFDFEKTKNRYFPYNLNSTDLVSEQLARIAFLVKNIEQKGPAKVIEFGSGWGNLAWVLGMTGFDVSIVEMNSQSIQLTNHRFSQNNLTLKAYQNDMLGFADRDLEQYDAIIFMASFHHCEQPWNLLKKLKKMLSPKGTIYLSNEPIFSTRSQSVPYPWGIRLDGVSVYVTRKRGWLELGFSASCFSKGLERTGLVSRRIPSYNKEVGDVWAIKHE